MKNKYRDLLGNICYYAENSNGLKFKVFKNYEGKFYIINCTGFSHSQAMEEIHENDNGIFLWHYTPVFDSFIHAVKYLKESVEYLY